MKIAYLLLSLAAAAPLAAQAAPAVHENRLFRLTESEAQRMRGEFRLDDGRVLTVTSKRHRIYAQLDGKTEELVPVADNTFVTHDGANRLVFNRVPFADEVVVTPVGPEAAGL